MLMGGGDTNPLVAPFGEHLVTLGTVPPRCTPLPSPRPKLGCMPPPASPARTVLKLGKRVSGAAPLKWKASKCLKSSGGCRGLVGRGREASRGLGTPEAGPAAGGRRAGSETRAPSSLCSQNKRLTGGRLGCGWSQARRSCLPLHKVALAKPMAITAHFYASPLHNRGEQKQRSHSSRLPAQKDDGPSPHRSS